MYSRRLSFCYEYIKVLTKKFLTNNTFHFIRILFIQSIFLLYFMFNNILHLILQKQNYLFGNIFYHNNNDLMNSPAINSSIGTVNNFIMPPR